MEEWSEGSRPNREALAHSAVREGSCCHASQTHSTEWKDGSRICLLYWFPFFNCAVLSVWQWDYRLKPADEEGGTNNAENRRPSAACLYGYIQRSQELFVWPHEADKWQPGLPRYPTAPVGIIWVGFYIPWERVCFEAAWGGRETL